MYNDKLIAGAETTIRSCEDELLKLKEISAADSSHWWPSGGAVSAREAYLRKKLGAAVRKLETLEARNAELKMVLVKEQ